MIDSASEAKIAVQRRTTKRRRRQSRDRHHSVNAERVRRVLTTELGFLYDPSFDAPDAEEVILTPPAQPNGRREKNGRAPKDIRDKDAYVASLYEVPLLTKEEEVHLFRKMNYLKFCAHRLRQKLDPRTATTKQVEQIERLWDQALRTREHLVRANLRLVFSIAKRYIGTAEKTFDELVSEGNLVLIRAVDRFDFARGTKFSTYATWAIMRSIFAAVNHERKYRKRFSTGLDPVLTDITDGREPWVLGNAEPELRALASQFVDVLDEREARIISARFGLCKDTDPQTLSRIGEQLGVSKERVRQLAVRALEKMRRFAAEQGMEVPSG
jgi:RNA polymerase primary sigma factor